MKAACMNSIPYPGVPTKDAGNMNWRVECGWRGEIEHIYGVPCPRCSKVGMLAPVVNVPRPESTGASK